MRSFRISQNDMLSHDSVEKSFLVPSRGKRSRPDVKAVLDNLENEIRIVQEMLLKGEFTPTDHEAVKINERNYQKVRKIVKPDYKYEQVIHHVVVQAIRPGIETGMYEFVLGSIPGRGQHMGAKRIEKWIMNDPANTKYVLKMDIRHFFESVDHDILKAWLKKKFRDAFILELLFLIIDAIDMGLPLGYYTSQWFANFLLQPLDHYIKENLHVKYDARYMDDITCFGRNKKELHRVRVAIDDYLNKELHLTMKGNWQIFRFEYEVEEYAIECQTMRELKALGSDLEKLRIRHRMKTYKRRWKIFINPASVRNKKDKLERLLLRYQAKSEMLTMVYGRPLDFMGFEFHRNRTVMRKGIMIRLNRKARQVSKQDKINPKDAASLLSSMGWVKHTDTYGMYEERIKPVVNIRKLKRLSAKTRNGRTRRKRISKGGRKRKMEIKWKTVTGSQEERPLVIDKTSSGKYVYLRRNIERITREESQGKPVQLWQYEEAAIPQDEYAPYDTVVMEIVQAELSNFAMVQAEQTAIIQANVEYIAMMADIDLEG